MNNEALISPYLENSFRTMYQICLENAARDGVELNCRDCARRQICFLVERNHRRMQKKRFLAAAKRH